MLLFIDSEYTERYERPELEFMLAARTRITYRIEALADMCCMLVRYERVTEELLDRLGVQALFISGHSTDQTRYERDDVIAFQQVLRDTDLPIFGFCGGWQLTATALGSPLTPIEVPQAHRGDEIIVEWADGMLAEAGYWPVDHAEPHPMLAGLDETSVYRHAHALHIAEPPPGFRSLASTPVTPVQLAVDDRRRIVGTQFHPEYWTDEHPDGRTLITNFLRWAGIGSSEEGATP